VLSIRRDKRNLAVRSGYGAFALIVAWCTVSSGCKPRRPTGSLQTAVEALRRGDAKHALDLVRAVARECSPNSECSWSARLLEAEVLLRNGQTDRADKLLSQEPPRTAQFRSLTARRMWLLGYLEYSRRHTEAAEHLLEESIALASAANSWDVVFEAKAMLAQLLFVLRSDRERSAALFREITEVAAKRNSPYYEAIAANGLGMMSLKSSRFDEAIPWFRRTIGAAKSGGGQRLEVAALQNLAICYSQLGSYDEALGRQREAIGLAGDAAFAPVRMELLGGMGNMYLQDDVPRAIDYFHQALDLADATSDIARWHRTLAGAYNSIHDWDRAEENNNQAKSLANPDDQGARAWAERNEAQIAAGRGRSVQARTLYQRLIGDANDSPELLWEAHAALAELYVESHDYNKANQEFTAAIGIINKNTDRLSTQDYKLTFFASLINFYHNYVRALIAQQDFDRALEVADSSRARSLVQALALGRTPAELPSHRYAEIARATGSVLLFYWVDPDKSYLWVVTPQGIQRPIELPPAEQIRRWVESYRGFIEDKLGDPMTTENEAGRRLYNALIAPAARWIQPGSSVTIFPDDALYWINFETLPVYGSSSGSRPHFWIEDARSSVAPSFGVMGLAKQEPFRIPDSLLIIGDPVPPSGEYPNLAYASREIKTIRSKFPAVTPVEFTGAMARPASYKASSPERFSLLHFSTHAVANKVSPLDSAIILSPDGGSFKLYARDIMDIPLKAELVTISACRTAGARSYSGEGLVGFAWAFLHAGARNVIAGLWDVTDSSTPDIMGVLYSELARGMTPRDALRQAKLSLIHSGTAYHKPYYWGPFELYAR